MATINDTSLFDDIPIIDSHIHLFPASELKTLAWNTPSNELWLQHAIPEYLASVNSSARFTAKHNLKGFVFLETDRKTALDDDEAWGEGPLMELEYLIDIANGYLTVEDGFHPDGSKLLLGIVPWAPLPAAIEELKEYIAQAKQVAGEKWHLVKGFRYLVQDKPSGTMLQKNFIDNLRYLGEQGLVFDLGVDYRSGGAWQLTEAVRMLELATADVQEDKQVRVIINHMCKPPMDSDSTPRVPDARVADWRAKLEELAQFPNTILKISGGFSEIRPLPKYTAANEAEHSLRLATVMEKIIDFIDAAASTFGTDRIIFGSDWPVCNIGGGGREVAWNDWLAIVRTWAAQRGLEREELEKLFWKTAQRAYNID